MTELARDRGECPRSPTGIATVAKLNGLTLVTGHLANDKGFAGLVTVS